MSVISSQFFTIILFFSALNVFSQIGKPQKEIVFGDSGYTYTILLNYNSAGLLTKMTYIDTTRGRIEGYKYYSNDDLGRVTSEIETTIYTTVNDTNLITTYSYGPGSKTTITDIKGAGSDDFTKEVEYDSLGYKTWDSTWASAYRYYYTFDKGKLQQKFTYYFSVNAPVTISRQVFSYKDTLLVGSQTDTYNSDNQTWNSYGRETITYSNNNSSSVDSNFFSDSSTLVQYVTLNSNKYPTSLKTELISGTTIEVLSSSAITYDIAGNMIINEYYSGKNYEKIIYGDFWIPAVAGLKDQLLPENFLLFPNPAVDFVNVKIKETIDIRSVQLINEKGETLLQDFTGGKIIPLQGIPSGSYLMQIETNTGKYPLHLLKE